MVKAKMSGKSGKTPTPDSNALEKGAGKAESNGAPLDIIAIELKASREARGLSVSQLHSITGIARTALHDYESGRYKPGANEIRKLCEALGITPNKLLTGRDNPETPATPLETVFGAGGPAIQVMKASQLLHLLPVDERDAFYKLLLGLVSARYPADHVKAVLERTDMIAGIMNFAAARVTNPEEEISEATATKRIAEIAPELVSDERAEKVQREREAKRHGPLARDESKKK